MPISESSDTMFAQQFWVWTLLGTSSGISQDSASLLVSKGWKTGLVWKRLADRIRRWHIVPGHLTTWSVLVTPFEEGGAETPKSIVETQPIKTTIRRHTSAVTEASSTPVSVHMVAIIIASACTLCKSLQWCTILIVQGFAVQALL